MRDWKNTLRKIDIVLVGSTLGLIAAGLLVLYSISNGSVGGSFESKQLIWTAAGLVVMTGLAFVNYKRLRHYAFILYTVNIFLLAAIYIIGKVVSGAQRWIEIGGFRFQPSELSKILLIITLGAFLAEKKGSLRDWRDVLRAIFHISPAILLIALQPDLGTALVLVAITAGMLVVAGISPKHTAILSLAVYSLVGLVIRLNLLQPYQMKRLVAFVNPNVDPLGSGYNLRQSMIAIGSGRIFGKGLFSGTQSRLNFLPESVRHNDFIFSVIGEELGFIGGVVVICLLSIVILRALRTAIVARNHFGVMIAAGIGSMWVFQVMVNVGMTIGIMPVTGVPLPFVSYGGSSMLINMAAVGLLLSVYRQRWD